MKDKLIIFFCILLFLGVGVYLTFISGNVNKYDSQTVAYKIDINESRDIDDNVTYYPTYYFSVSGVEYKCEAKSGSSTYPKENKNKVYYDSNNPEKCSTEYEKSTNTFAGIICFILALVMLFIFTRIPSNSKNEYQQVPSIDLEKQNQINNNIQNAAVIIDKIQLIIKRIFLGISIFVLLISIIIDSLFVRQTIIAKDYIDTVAVYSEQKNSDSSVFNDYIYTFNDKNGVKQEIVVGVSKDDIPQNEIKIKYNENNPQDYYEEGGTYSKSKIIWFIVKIILLIFLIILFFNKKLLSKINIFINKK